MSDTVDWMFFSMTKAIDVGGEPGAAASADESWARFLRRLGDAADAALSRPIPTASVDRASAVRGLLELLHFGLEQAIGRGDPYRPAFSRPWPVHAFDFGAGNPDAVYRTVPLHDDATYRVWGRLGNARYLSFEFFAGQQQAGSLVAGHLDPAPDGSFELLLGGPDAGERAWALMPGTNGILMREFFDDWSAARVSEVQIACESARSEPWPRLDGVRVARELDALGDWLVATVGTFTGFQEKGLAEHRNAFDPQVTRPDSDLPKVYHAYWDLGPDDALVIAFDPSPHGTYWSFQLTNYLWNTLDHAHRLTSLNNAQVARDDDGRVRLVLAHCDPGVANWLDTLGHRQGAILFRSCFGVGTGAPPPLTSRDLAQTRNAWMERWTEDARSPDRSTARLTSTSVPEPPETTVVPINQLRDVLPTSTRRVDATERERVIAERHRHVHRLLRS